MTRRVNIELPVRTGEPRRPGGYGRRRAAVLGLVYLLFFVHVIHWRLTGSTLAPLEFSEVMYTVEMGMVTAGFLFMAVACVSVFVFGRFFCSWGCHILALQDLCTWLLGKLRIRPVPVNSRSLMLVPPAIMFYMFAWPWLRRYIVGAWPGAVDVIGKPPPFDLRVLADVDGWGSFITENFWRNLPGPGIAVATLFVCGFAIVYLLGSRSFCRYVCPYGAAFALADRIAPGRIRLTGDCVQCAKCTAGCPSNVRVHEEIKQYGMVVDSACLKDLDCIAGCPEQAISYGFGKPSLFARPVTPGINKRSPTHLSTEFGLLVLFVFVMIIFSGVPDAIIPWAGVLYGVMPLFLSASLSVASAFLVLHLGRLAVRSHMRLQRIELKRDGKLRRGGVVFLGLSFLWLLFVGHSGFVQYHMFQAGRVIARTSGIRGAVVRQDKSVLENLDRGSQGLRAAVSKGERHLQRAEKFGLAADTRIPRQRAWLCLVRGDAVAAEYELRRAITMEPEHPDTYHQLGLLLAVRGDSGAATRELLKADELSVPGGKFLGSVAKGAAQLASLGLREKAAEVLAEGIAMRPKDLGLPVRLNRLLREAGDNRAVVDVARRLLQRSPELHSVRLELAALLLREGSTELSTSELKWVLEHQPESAQAHTLLGRALLPRSPKDAIPHLEKAVALIGVDPNRQSGLAGLRADLAQAYAENGEFDKAELLIRENLQNPETKAGSLFMLGELRRAQGREEEALEFFQRAQAVNPRFRGN